MNATYIRPFADEVDGDHIKSALETLTRISGSFIAGLTMTTLLAVVLAR